LRVLLVGSGNAFLPEITAYEQYLTGYGIQTEFSEGLKSYESGSCDAVIVAMGFVGRWKRVSVPLICDYASQSVRSPRILRDVTKRVFGRPPDLGVYQNERIKAWSPQGNSVTYRHMGYFPEYVRARAASPSWDVVYVGETNRPGLSRVLGKLSDWGLRVAVVGPPEPVPPSVERLGRLPISQTYEVMSRCSYGLNYVPIRRPWMNQQSTKLIEYAASGLNVISSRTPWVEQFVAERAGSVAWLDELRSLSDLSSVRFRTPDVSDLTWEQVMGATGVAQWLLEVRDHHSV
jgi:hypothetical protein